MNKGNDESDSDDASEGSSRQRGTVTRDDGRAKGGNSGSAIEYTANIAAACNAVNAESKRSRSPSEVNRLEKRRESNRLSARRCRRRRREEMNELSEELKRQSQINEALVLEQKVLKEELEREIQGLQQGNQGVAVLPMSKPVPKAPPPPPPPSQLFQMGGQDQALQSLLGVLMQNSAPPPIAPAPDMSAVNALASFLGNPSQVTAPMNQTSFASFLSNSATANANTGLQLSQEAFASFLGNSTAANVNPVPLSHEALLAASAMLGGASPALAGFPVSAAAAAAPPAPVTSPPLYARSTTDNNDFSARLARLEAAMNPPAPVPNQAVSSDLLRLLLGGQGAAGAPMPPFSGQNP